MSACPLSCPRAGSPPGRAFPADANTGIWLGVGAPVFSDCLWSCGAQGMVGGCRRALRGPGHDILKGWDPSLF